MPPSAAGLPAVELELLRSPAAGNHIFDYY